MNEKQRQWMADNMDIVDAFRKKIEEKATKGERVVLTKIAKELRQEQQALNTTKSQRGGRTPAWLSGAMGREYLARNPDQADLFSAHISKSVEEVQAMSPQARMTAALLELELRIDEMEKAISYLSDPVKPWFKRIFS